MKRVHAAWFSAVLAAMAAAVGIVGCETESASGRVITISPSYARLEKGNSLTLTASGGWDYRWLLETPTAGYLNKTTGSQVTYTATKDGVTQTVTVRGMFSSDNSSYAESHATIVQGDEDYAATATAPSTTTIATGGSSSGNSSGNSSSGGSSGGSSSSNGSHTDDFNKGDELPISPTNTTDKAGK